MAQCSAPSARNPVIACKHLASCQWNCIDAHLVHPWLSQSPEEVDGALGSSWGCMLREFGCYLPEISSIFAATILRVGSAETTMLQKFVGSQISERSLIVV